MKILTIHMTDADYETLKARGVRRGRGILDQVHALLHLSGPLEAEALAFKLPSSACPYCDSQK